MFCRYCGAKIREEAEFCPKCGKKLKNNRKKMRFGKKVAVAVFAGIFMLGLLGYGYWDRNRGREEKELVLGFMEAYTQLDESTCREYLYNIENITEEKGFSDFQKEMAKRLTYEIKGFSEENGYSVVNLNVTNIDFQEIMDTILADGEEMSGEQFEEALQEMLSSEECPERKFECEVNVYQSEGKIEITETFSNALLGGFPEYVATLIGRNGV